MSKDLAMGIQSTIGGMTQAVDPSLLQDTQYAFGLNITTRKGLAHTRPVFSKIEATLPVGKWQGASAYNINGDNRIVFCVSGKVYSLKLNTMEVISHAGTLDATVERVYFTQADRYMIVQDGVAGDSWDDANWPVIIHEDDDVDQSAIAEHQRVPKGAMMAYGHGRLFVAVNYIFRNEEATENLGRVGFIAGDIIQPFDPSTLLNFTEEEYLAEGGRVIMPEELGLIYTMDFQKNIMSGVGAGPLIVGAEKGFSAFQVNAPRDQWKDIDFGVVMFSGIGTRSPSSTLKHNADIYYRSQDGLRSLKDTAAKLGSQAGLTNDSISEEIADILSLDDFDDQEKTTLIRWKDRLLMTTAADDGTFKAIVSLDLRPITSIQGGTPPIYDGIWTGLDIHTLIGIDDLTTDQAYIFAKQDDTNTVLFRLDDTGYQDNESGAPLCRIYTGEKHFDKPFSIKKMKYLDLWLSNIRGDVDVTVYFRADKYPFWSKLSTETFKSDPAVRQRRNKIRFSTSSVEDDQVLGGLLNAGFNFQFCFEWTGHAQFEKSYIVTEYGATHNFTVTSDTEQELISSTTDTPELNDYTYEVEL